MEIDGSSGAGVEEIDPLDALIVELERIEGQQVTLKDAVQNSKPIVVHPRREVGSWYPTYPHLGLELHIVSIS